jgi:general secretion pathway protein I
MKSRVQRGFTLMEVVVAFVILALALGALYPGISEALQRGSRSGARELAQLKAASLLATYRGSDGLLPNPGSGTDTALNMAWKVSASPYPAEIDPSANYQAMTVTATVQWGTGERRVALQSIELVSRRQ